MSPMRRVAEAACRTPEVPYTDNMETPRESNEMVDTHHIDEERNSTLRQIPPTERNIPTTSEQHSNQWQDDNREPGIIMEHVPLLNRGPSNLWSEHETSSEAARIITTTPAVTTRTTSIEAVSISSTAQVSSTGMAERIPTTRPICLPEEDPQIPCPVCDVIDCMIHNPRHLRCGQRLLGPHTCPNTRDHLEPPIVQHPIPINATEPTEPVQRRAHSPGDPLFLPDDTDVESLRGMVLNSTHMLNMDLISRPVPPIPPLAVTHRSSLAELPTYDEAIMYDQGITAQARIAPRTQNVLHHIDYSSDPEEARIHF